MRPVVLVGCSNAFTQRVQAALSGGTGLRLQRWTEPPMRSGTVAGVLTSDPLVVVIGPEVNEREAFELASRLDQTGRGLGVVVIADHRQGTLDRALAAGVRAVVPPTADAEALRAAIERTAAAARKRGATQAKDPAKPKGGRVITVTSPKGGAGKTVLASNLAVSLATIAPRKVVIVDLDLQFGDIAYAFSLDPSHTVFDAVTAGHLDPTALKVYLTHHRSDLYALCAPDDPAKGELVEAPAVTGILEILASAFDFVVVDTGAGLTEHTLAALDASSDSVFVADADVPSIRHLAKVVRALDRLGMKANRHFVLNRADARIGVRIADVLASVGLRTDIEIPTSREVPISLSHGIPIALSNPKSSMARGVARLAERIADDAQQDPSTTGSLERSA
jgi:pilus assembly protein CpaE